MTLLGRHASRCLPHFVVVQCLVWLCHALIVNSHRPPATPTCTWRNSTVELRRVGRCELTIVIRRHSQSDVVCLFSSASACALHALPSLLYYTQSLLTCSILSALQLPALQSLLCDYSARRGRSMLPCQVL